MKLPLLSSFNEINLFVLFIEYSCMYETISWLLPRGKQDSHHAKRTFNKHWAEKGVFCKSTMWQKHKDLQLVEENFVCSKIPFPEF